MHEYKKEAQAIKTALEKAVRILVISHQKPDGDTLGSGTAWINYLLALGKDVTAFALDKVPEYLSYLPNSWRYTTDENVFNQLYDLIIILDSGSLQYAGVDFLLTKTPKSYQLINIDHHTTNPRYGDINLVIPSASSTCEITSRYFNFYQIKITPGIATSLLTGIMTDTSSFGNPATNYQVVAIASQLVNDGADLFKIVQKTLRNQNVNKLRLWGKALSRLKINNKYKFATTYITQKDLKEEKADPDVMEGLANYLAVLNEANAVMILRETENGQLKGSLRTPFAKIDLSRLAQILGGGGHKKASGFTIDGKIEITADKWHVA